MPIPASHRHVGLHIDVGRPGVAVEIQFSNYPFLVDNVFRAERLFRGGVAVGGAPIRALVIVAKGHVFPASQSTLYYESAVRQVTDFVDLKLITMPVRLVGLSEAIGATVGSDWNVYSGRTSRTQTATTRRQARLDPGARGTSRARIVLV